MDNGWQASAEAWIEEQGEHGDFGRQYVLDPVMLPRALARSPRRALDLGCGEGRFCRALNRRGIKTIGIDPTETLIATARDRDPRGTYLKAAAERLPFSDGAFDLIVSYLTLIDIADFRTAIAEAVRVLAPGGTLLIANLNPFITALADQGWVKNADGERLHYPVDHYLDERAVWVEWQGIRIVNHHRPMSLYLQTLLKAGMTLTFFDEPSPSSDTPRGKTHSYRRAPWFLVMEWLK